jgi:leucyl-tRNA synthetase
MTLTRAITRATREGADRVVVDEAIDTLLKLLAPFAPHLAAEAWERRHPGGHVHTEPWPVADAALLVDDQVTMVVQVNGKVRDRIEVDASISEDDAIASALSSQEIQAQLAGRTPSRIVARPPRLVNIVV